MIFRIFIFISVFATQNLFSQDYSTLIQEHKYSKAWKKIQKTLHRDSNDVNSLFYASMVSCSESAGNIYNPDASYIFFIKAKTIYLGTTDLSTLEALGQKNITIYSFKSLLDTISNSKLKQAAIINTEEIYVKILREIPDLPSTYRIIAISKRNNLGFENAKRLNTEDGFESFISKYPDATEVKQAEILRNGILYTECTQINTVLAYQKFIKKYPRAEQIPAAWENVYRLEFNLAASKNSVEFYQNFISQYPKASQVKQAKLKIHELSYEIAKNKKSSLALKDFLNLYPDYAMFTEAFYLMEKIEYEENTVSGDWNDYKRFIENFPSSSMVQNAIDFIYKYAIENRDVNAIEYIINNINNEPSLAKIHYNIITEDGELKTLEEYKIKYPDYEIDSFDLDMKNATIGKQLMLHLPYDKSKESAYIDYISRCNNKDMSFVAVQRILSPLIASKKYNAALSKLNSLPVNHSSLKITQLKQLLASKIDLSIKPLPIYKLNSNKNEFSPILAADEKKIYFCGKDRPDNLGGEDIFESSIQNSTFSAPKINPSLSQPYSNEAPVCLSSDGNTMILFRSGKLFSSQKLFGRWEEPVELSESINSGLWQGDATITNDGNAILFAAVRPGESFNTNSINDKHYHGDINYPTDIFISKRNMDNSWSMPLNIGSTINTRYCERYPFLHPDMKTLYFSSDGHAGLGKTDVFMSTRLFDTCWNCWSEPINLGKEINTSENDGGYKISTSGDKAYFSLHKLKPTESSVLFLLDISGSMGGSKIEELKRVSKTTIQEVIDNNAEVAIAAFDGSCENAITQYLPFSNDLTSIEYFIDQLRANGVTPMYEAFYEASHILKTQSKGNTKNKIIVLMTDGDANDCYRNLDAVLRQLSSEGCLFKTQTIAYQVSPSSKAYYDLNKISTATKGAFFYAANSEDLGSAFEQANSNIFKIVSGPEDKDIYTLNLPPHLRPDFVAKIEGQLKNSKNQAVSTTIRWEDLETATVIGTSKSDPNDGSYFIILPMGKNYGYFIQDSFYFPTSQNLDLRNKSQAVTINKDIVTFTIKEMIEDGILVPMNNLFFDFGKSNLLSSSIPELTRISKIIKSNNLKVEISGHTDNIGAEIANQQLSEDRAKSVKDFLISQGCRGENLKTIGYGISSPMANNNTEEGRAINRRVEIKFIK